VLSAAASETGVGAVALVGSLAVTAEGVAIAGYGLTTGASSAIYFAKDLKDFQSSGGEGGTGAETDTVIEIKDGIRYINGYKAIINPEKQARHLLDTVEGTRSYLTTDAQTLLNEVGGTGYFVQPYKEVVNVGSNVGKYVDPITGIAVDTTRVTIHYSNTGVHIVPAPPA